jgi:hypothetical protein
VLFGSLLSCPSLQTLLAIVPAVGIDEARHRLVHRDAGRGLPTARFDSRKRSRLVWRLGVTPICWLAEPPGATGISSAADPGIALGLLFVPLTTATRAIPKEETPRRFQSVPECRQQCRHRCRDVADGSRVERRDAFIASPTTLTAGCSRNFSRCFRCAPKLPHKPAPSR